MRSHRMTVLLTVLLLIPSIGVAQEMSYLGAQLDSKIDSARKAARDSFTRLLNYPPETQLAALEVAQYPELVMQIKGAGPGLDGVISSYPAGVQSSARELARYPDLLSQMQAQLLSTMIMGQVYGEQKTAVRQALTSMTEHHADRNAAATAAWATRLQQNPAAGIEYQNAANQASQASELTKPGLPSDIVVRNALENADRYPALAAAIVDQWEQEQNPDQFRRTVDMWYAQNRDELPGDFIGDATQRANLLKEHATFSKNYEAFKASNPMNASVSRLDYLDSHQKDYPNLTAVYQDKIYAMTRPRVTRVAGGPVAKKGGGSSSRSSGSSTGTSTGSRNRSTRSSTGSNGSVVGTTGGRLGQNRGNSRNNKNSNSGSGFGNSGGSNFGSGGFGNGGFGSGGSSFGNSGGSFGNSGSSFGNNRTSNSRNNNNSMGN